MQDAVDDENARLERQHEREVAERARQAEESRVLMPAPLADVRIGMTGEALNRAHPGLRPSRGGMLEETMENGAQVLFRVEADVLQQ